MLAPMAKKSPGLMPRIDQRAMICSTVKTQSRRINFCLTLPSTDNSTSIASSSFLVGFTNIAGPREVLEGKFFPSKLLVVNPSRRLMSRAVMSIKSIAPATWSQACSGWILLPDLPITMARQASASTSSENFGITMGAPEVDECLRQFVKSRGNLRLGHGFNASLVGETDDETFFRLLQRRQYPDFGWVVNNFFARWPVKIPCAALANERDKLGERLQGGFPALEEPRNIFWKIKGCKLVSH